MDTTQLFPSFSFRFDGIGDEKVGQRLETVRDCLEIFLTDLFLLSAGKSKRRVHKLGRHRKNRTCGHQTANLFDLPPLKLSQFLSFNPTRPLPKFLIGWYMDQGQKVKRCKEPLKKFQKKKQKAKPRESTCLERAPRGDLRTPNHNTFRISDLQAFQLPNTSRFAPR